ncbi:MAG: hypothetical protein HZY77_04105 [Thiobacillus sp.]|uniref:hypothetical protein n=1 Tax=Thiobacillus sp. TaxID=924 RepID=UPI00168C1C1E|nr:hypothetical protein [Thiobacillus sp.]QLQ02146.1 MAG: hypothetical protein HZY77_04105 [Thiobacillus sp.]
MQVSQLEQALQQQAGTLARELLQNAESARARMLAESAEKLRLAGEHEVLGAKVEAERLVRRQGQAAETRLAAELDRLRWALTESALAEVKIAFRHLVQDETRYLDVLEAWLAAAAQALPPGDLVAEVRPEDEKRLAPRWMKCARARRGVASRSPRTAIPAKAASGYGWPTIAPNTTRRSKPATRAWPTNWHA